MAERKHTDFVLLTFEKDPPRWVEQSVELTGPTAEKALEAALDRQDIDLAEGDIVSVVAKRHWRPFTLAVETQLKITFKR